MAVDLAQRTFGLLPTWLVLLTAASWSVAMVVLWPRRRTVAQELAAIGALGLAWLLFFWRPLTTPAQVPRGGGDLASFFFPLHAFAARTVQEGHLPFWNPTVFSGLPHWANYQAGTLYPPNWLAWLLARPFSYGTLERLVLVHYLVASLGAYALARHGLGLARPAALAAGIVFPYSGFLVAHLGHYSMLAAAVWIPWLWLALARLVATARWRWVLATTLATFLLVTAGHQQTVLYGLVASGLWWLVCVVRWRDTDRRKFFDPAPPERWTAWSALLLRVRPLGLDVFRVGLGVSSGLLLAAPALLPSLELARRSVRAGGLSYEQATEFALRPIALLTFVLPRLWGDDPTDWWGPWASGEVWAYAGIVTLLLAGIGLSLGREPLRWGLAGIGLLALLHALGPETPVHGWVYRFLPFADLLRAPARTLLFVDLVLALLAGIGLAVVTDAARAERPLLRTVERSLVVVVAALALLVTPLFLLPIIASATPPERTVIALEGAVLALLWLALALVWLRTSRTRRLGTPSALAGLALLTVDLFSATAPFNPTPDDVLVDFRHPTVVETVRTASERDGPWRLLSLTIRWQPSAAAVHGLEDAGGLFDPMQPAAYAKALDCARSAPDRPLVDLLNVRFLLARADSGSPGSRYRRQALTPDGLAVWENPEALPRAWLAGRATLASPREALDRLCHPDFDPRQELLLAGSLPPADPAASGSARATWDGPNRFQVRVRASAPAYLVVAVTADPGWRAFVDGEPVDIALADGIYQVIWVPAGQHTLVFEYRPPYLGWGSLAAGLAASLLLLASLGRAVVSRRSRTPPSKPSATVNVLLDHAARPAGHDVRDVSVTLRSPEPVSAVTSAP